MKRRTNKMKNKLKYISLSALCALLPLTLVAQNDSVLDRNVIVEREFQPVIQHAGKLNTPLKQVETKIEPVQLTYSDYSSPFAPQPSTPTLTASQVRFAHPQPNNGWLTLAVGHPLTYLDFGYGIKDKSGLQLNLFANHDAQWGRKTWSESRLGMNIQKSFTNTYLQFDIDGNHLFYTRYGRYYDGKQGLTINKYSNLLPEDKQQAWTINTMFSVVPRSGVMPYYAQVGYTAHILPDFVNEHMLRTRLWAGLELEEHTAAVTFVMQNTFMTVDSKTNLADSLYNNRHAFRIEPYYEYNTDNLRLHVGVNLDLNVGKGQLLTGNPDLSFAPSPNVELEYRIIPSWLVLYANAKGSYGYGTVQTFMFSNPYLDPVKGIISHHVSKYSPVDAALGFKIKAAKGLLIDIYGGYAMLNNEFDFVAPTMADLGNHTKQPIYMGYKYADYQQWKVGAQINYHYQDIIRFVLSGNYYYWDPKDKTNGVLDRPMWDANLLIEGNIDSKWSLYSENCLTGSRRELLSDYKSIVTLKPIIDLSVGVKYNVNRWIYCYAKINNYLHRYNDIYYGYQSCGINGTIGLSWKF